MSISNKRETQSKINNKRFLGEILLYQSNFSYKFFQSEGFNSNYDIINNGADENIFNLCVHQHFQPAVSEIDYTYNVWCTGFKDRLERVFLKPLRVGAFKPDEERISYFQDEGLIPWSLMELFEEYKML